MATDRDEQQRQKQELEEIRRSFAEMGARMGSLFDPPETEEDKPRALVPAPQDAPAPVVPPRSRWWAAAALVLLFLAGGLVGYLLPRAQADDAGPPPPSVSPTTPAAAATPAVTSPPRTRTSVPETCLETAERGDQVIAYLIRNIRDNRLSSALKNYTLSSQACRREASP
jgi:hypothetical protein